MMQFLTILNQALAAATTGGELSLMLDSCKLSSDSSGGGGGWMTGGCVSCSARFSLLFSGFVGLERGGQKDGT